VRCLQPWNFPSLGLIIGWLNSLQIRIANMKWLAMSPDSWKDLKKYSSTLMAGPVGSVADPDPAGSGLFLQDQA
jgi:hypothetical protein